MACSERLIFLATLGIISTLGAVSCSKDSTDKGRGTGSGGSGGNSGVSGSGSSGSSGGSGGSSSSSGSGGSGGSSTGSTGSGGSGGSGSTAVDTTPLPGVNLMPNEEGFMKADKNDLHIQGAWYSFGCAGASIEPKEGARYDNSGKMCFKGTAPMVTDKDGDGSPDYSTIWGAGIGFDLCAQSEEEATKPDGTDAGAGPTKYPLSACPYNAELATKLIGVAVRFSGSVNATELRVQFNEGDNVANSYYKVTPTQVAAGTKMMIEFEDPLVRTHYNTKLKPGDADANNILAIQFMIPTNTSAEVDWDFCVEDIAAITAP